MLVLLEQVATLICAYLVWLLSGCSGRVRVSHGHPVAPKILKYFLSDLLQEFADPCTKAIEDLMVNFFWRYLLLSPSPPFFFFPLVYILEHYVPYTGFSILILCFLNFLFLCNLVCVARSLPPLEMDPISSHSSLSLMATVSFLNPIGRLWIW